MCMGCLACESVCAKGAISIVIDREGMKSYKIHDSKWKKVPVPGKKI